MSRDSAIDSRATVISTRAAPSAGTNGSSRPGSSTPSNTSRRPLPSASSQCRTAWPASAAPGREPPTDSPAASATAASPASRVSLSRALTHAMSRQLSASLARAYAAASWVLPTPEVPVSTTGGLWPTRFSCASKACLGWKPGRGAGISPTTTWSFVVVRAGGSAAYGSLMPTAG